uniref:Nuclear receptor n=1 Tax=Strongyloides stercoralis TaxID=6248 RepID=A0A0K0EJJ7_STRER
MSLSQLSKKENTSEKNVIIPTNCVICGKSASCYHYDVISCNGCKTFFRRSVIADKNYICKFDNNCVIERRINCKKCRFDKCLSSGMNPRAIQFPSNMTKEEIFDLLEKYTKNKEFDKNYQDNNKNNHTLCPYLMSYNHKISEFQTMISNCLNDLTYIEYKFKLLRESNFKGSELFKYDLNNYLMQYSKLGDAEKYLPPTNWPIPMSEPKEKHILDSTREDFIYKKHMHLKHHKPWFQLDEYLVVDYIKTLHFFQKIPHSDQIAIIKNIGPSLYIAGVAYYSFIKNKKSVYFPDGFEPLKIHKKYYPIEEEVFHKSVRSFYRVNFKNEEFCLFKTIIICSCVLDGISESSKRILENQKNFYSNILLKYLQNELGTIEGVKRYMEIVMFIETIFILAEKFKELGLLIDIAHSKINDLLKKKPRSLFIIKQKNDC